MCLGVCDTRLRITVWDIRGRGAIAYLEADGVDSRPDNDFKYLARPEPYTAFWNGRNADGERVAAGQYFVTVEGQGIPSILASAGIADLGIPQDEAEEIPDEEFINGGELREGAGLRGGNYLIAYTYANEEMGIETPPSPIAQIRVLPFDTTTMRAPYALRFSNYLQELPDWADRVKFYVKRGYLPRDITQVKDTLWPLSLIHI